MHWIDAVSESPFKAAIRYTKDRQKVIRRGPKDVEIQTWWSATRKGERVVMEPASPHDVDGYLDWEPVLSTATLQRAYPEDQPEESGASGWSPQGPRAPTERRAGLLSQPPP